MVESQTYRQHLSKASGRRTLKFETGRYTVCDYKVVNNYWDQTTVLDIDYISSGIMRVIRRRTFPIGAFPFGSKFVTHPRFPITLSHWGNINTPSPPTSLSSSFFLLRHSGSTLHIVVLLSEGYPEGTGDL